jgi:hypothetical protein
MKSKLNKKIKETSNDFIKYIFVASSEQMFCQCERTGDIGETSGHKPFDFVRGREA